MRKLLPVFVSILIAGIVSSPAFAASWNSAVDAAIAKGKYESIDQIVARNPGKAGEIAVYLLQQAKQDVTDSPDKSVALFNTSVHYAPQISRSQAPDAVESIKVLLSLANDRDFQKRNPNGAADNFTNALSVLSLPVFAGLDPKLKGAALADAGEFLSGHPDLDDNKLKDDVLLAQGFDLGGVNADPATTRYVKRGPPVTPVIVPPSAE